MILGRLIGKLTTATFQFEVTSAAKKFQYVQVYHKEYDYVLCQITELIRDEVRTIAKCNILGNYDGSHIRPIRTPFDPSSEVLDADPEFIRKLMGSESSSSIFIGTLEDNGIPVYLDINELLSKHIAILAKSGSGKSYTVGVLLEELMEKHIPLLVIDTHGEYAQLREQNDSNDDIIALQKLGLLPKAFRDSIQEYGSIETNSSLNPLRLNIAMSGEELISMLPLRLSSAQLALLYGMENTGSFEDMLLHIQHAENPQKFSLINAISYLQKLALFSHAYTPYNELVQPGKCSLINMRGIAPEVQEIIVAKLLKDLFEQRKKGAIPPFFAVIEESHNYCPERNFGETKASPVIRTIASEGRKFGMGLCVVSQRPARIDKSVLSQCSTQIMLKITNPNDIRAIASSAEDMTADAGAELSNLPVGTAMLTGITDMPFFVSIRPRKTRHGGHAVSMLGAEEEEPDTEAAQAGIVEEVQQFREKNLLPIIKPKISREELRLSAEKPVTKITTYLIPAVQFVCVKNAEEFNIIMDRLRGEIITDIAKSASIRLPEISSFTANELNVLQAAITLQEFSEKDLQSACPLEPSMVQHIFTSLLKKDLFNFHEGRYKLQPSFSILFSPKELASYETAEYASVSYDQQLAPKRSPEELKDRLSRFVSVKDAKECWIVYHKAEYEE